jgi:lipopolysaccharide export LptBFGC system permease protein LptF
LGLGLYGIAAIAAVNLEAWGRRELIQFLYRKSQTELDNMIKYKLQSGVFLDDFLGYVLYAEKVSSDHSKFENVLLAPGGDHRQAAFTLVAPSGRISGSVQTGDLKLSLDFGMAYSLGQSKDASVSIVKFNRADIDLLRIFREQIIGSDAADDDFRSFTPSELLKYIKDLAAIEKRDEQQETALRRARFLWHQRIAAPFAVLTFALFGMVLGVADPRRGKSSAYIGAIVTIMIGYVLMMGFKSWAEMGLINPWVAAWLPNLILAIVGGFLVYQKNRLPPSEGTLDLANLPYINRFKIFEKYTRKRA